MTKPYKAKYPRSYGKTGRWSSSRPNRWAEGRDVKTGWQPGYKAAPQEIKTVRVWNFFGWKVWTRDFDGRRVNAGGTYKNRQEAEAGAYELSYRTFTGRNEAVWS